MGRKKKSSIGCLFWVALILLVLVVFLFNRKTIETVLDKTGLMQYLVHEREDDESPIAVRVTDDRTSTDDPPEPTPERRREPPRTETPTVQPPSPPASDDGAIPSSDPAKPDEPVDDIVVTEEPQTNQDTTQTSDEVIRSEKLRRSTLYFVYVDPDGAISLEQVVRPVSYVDSPLTHTLQALLKGLSTSELSKGLLSLVPHRSELHRVWVKDGVAYIDFNEFFRFNSFGREGYQSQLKQIVYTATEFPTVQSVQILIDGNTLHYLGPESPYVGEPLSRQSL